MKLYRISEMISLKDGSNHILFDFRDFLELVDQTMGHEAAKWLENYATSLEEAADYTHEQVNTDLNNYEASLDSNKTVFQDIEDECRAMISDFNKEQGRNRLIALRPWRNRVEQILKIINNQI